MKIPPKEANLFLKSDICKEFEWLVLELDKYKIPELKEKDFEKLSLQYQMFLEQNWYSLFKRTQKEWKIEKRDFDSEDPDFRCQLCNRPHLHKLSTIVNVINNNELTVGSICIKDFDYILHNSLLDKKIYNEEKRKEAKKLKVIEYILGYNPEVMYKIKYFKSVFNTTNWILNEKLEEDKININKLLERDFYPQLEVNKIDNVNLKKVSYSEKRINKFLEEFDNYKTFCKTDEWGINSQVATWCFSERNKDKFLIKDLMSDGKITVNTVDRIIEPHFLKKIISIFKNQITMINFKILSIQEAIFIGYFIDKDNVKLEINNSSFIKKYKTNLFNKNEEVMIKYYVYS